MTPPDHSTTSPDDDPNMPLGSADEDARPLAVTNFLEVMDAELPLDATYHPDRGMVMKTLETGASVPLCSPIRVTARGRTLEGGDWTTLVTFLDPDDGLQRASLANSDLQERPRAIVAELVGRGFVLEGTVPQFVELLRAWRPERRVWLARQPGWLQMRDKSWAYVDPAGRAYAPTDTAQSSVALAGAPEPAASNGDLAGWQASVGTYARRNPALIAAISVALSGALLRWSGLETLGLNFHASTSLGKSTAGRLALSCAGNPFDMETWSGTEAGLEALADQANDGLLVLDEFPAKPEKHVLATAYALGNGTGKTRSTRTRGAAETVRYRLALLSTSELPLAALFANSRTAMPGGVATRLIDIPAGAWRHGLFEHLHGYETGHDFSGALTDAAREHHGQVLPAFLSWLVRRGEVVETRLPRLLDHFERRARTRLGPLQGPHARVVRRLGLVAAAGELGAEAGVLPWQRGEAVEALLEIAELWKGHHDLHQPPSTEGLVERLRTLVAARERFADLDDPATVEGVSAGWIDANWVYLDPEIFADEVAEDLGVEAAARHLRDAGYLRAGGEKNSLQYRLPKTRVRLRPRVYRVSLERLERE